LYIDMIGTEKEPVMSSSYDSDQKNGFRWNAGGWFGGQIGSTVWLLILGVLLMWQDVVSGLAAIGAFVVPNIVGTMMWRRRHEMPVYPTIQWLFAVMGLCTLTVLMTVKARAVEIPGYTVDLPWWIMFIYPAIILQMHFIHRATTRAAKRTDNN